jgi:hypothetical protein
MLSQPVNVHIVVVVLRSAEAGIHGANGPCLGRTLKLILKQQYGLKTLEERLTGFMELYKEKQKKQAALKKKIANNEALDIMNMLPPSVLVGIDRFLKAGLFTCGTLFILAGLFITAEAWSKASNQPLPTNLDNFIVNIVEPNFTPGLLVLLGFSVSLGAFAALQLSSSSRGIED